MKSAATAFTGIVGAFLAVAPAAHGTPPHVTLALTGQKAPGFDGDVRFTGITDVFLNDAGLVTLRARLAGEGIPLFTDDDAIWVGRPGDLQLVAHEGNPAPGAGDGVVFENLLWIGATVPAASDGTVVFESALAGPGVNTSNHIAFWMGKPGSLQMVARMGDPAPGMPGVAYASSEYVANNFWPKLNAAGQLTYHGLLAGPGITGRHDSIWTGPPSSPSVAVQTGQQAPGAPEGWVFGNVSLLRRTDSGLVVVHGWVEPESQERQRGLWGDTLTSLQPIMLTGTHAPGTPAGTNFAWKVFYDGIESGQGPNPAINDAGQLVFVSYLAGDGVDRFNDHGVWAGRPGDLDLVARSGSQAPGLPAGVLFGRASLTQPGFPPTFWEPQIDTAGQVAFVAGLTGAGVTPGNDESIWFGLPEDPRLLAREGDPAPGAPEGIIFQSIGQNYPGFSLLETGANRIAFRANLSGPGTTPEDYGIWVISRSGDLMLVARTGELFGPGEGPGRIIDTIGELNFNSHGELAMVLTFTDGSSGAFLFTVPEPAMLAMWSASIGVLALRRRRSA